MTIKAPKVHFSAEGGSRKKAYTVISSSLLDKDVMLFDELVVQYKTTRASLLRAIVLKELGIYPEINTLKDYINIADPYIA